jgi:metallophosphoesterase superfamily enzyme
LKVAVITDQHFGARKGNQNLHEYFKKFYDTVFFPTLKKECIDTIIDMGDTFDTRKGIDFWSLNWAKENYYNILRDMGVTVHTIVGNHTAYYKDTNDINSVDLLLREYDNVVVYGSPTEVKIGGLDMFFIPWINDENREETVGMINSTKSKVAFGHLEMRGFFANKTYICEHGEDKTNYKKFEKVFSGHYHHRNFQDNIYYLGNPYEIYWHDVEETRGCHIFDTETLEHTPVNNPHRLFHIISYEDTPHQTFNAEPYKDKIVKVVVNKKSNGAKFERFIDKLYQSGVNDLKIVENFDFNGFYQSDEFTTDESENTLSILNRYVDESECSLNTSKVKSILEKVYTSACEVD